MAKRQGTGQKAGLLRFPTRGWWSLAIVVLVVVGVAAFVMPGLTSTAEAGTAYMARVGCSCRFVAGRDMDSCKTDKLEGMELITMVDDPDARSVTARFPLLASATASYDEGFGCRLEPWDD